MGFASSWLEKSAIFPQFISEEPNPRAGIIVVVPAYNEPDICVLLNSLNECEIPSCKTEVMIVINAPPSASEEQIANNKANLEIISQWRTDHDPFFKLFCFETPSLKGWGVGMARKSGMDEALRRFDKTGNPEGVILSLDADCTVDKNYFISIEKELYEERSRSACSVYFEHDISDAVLREEIAGYELHLRYYLQGLKYSGFPYAYHTVGSSMAVKASAYLKSGGMNRKQAGEDFYFIQKLVGDSYFSLVSTTVYPSSRRSYRVPFGTGAAMEKLYNAGTKTFETYTTESFTELKQFFDRLFLFYDCDENELGRHYYDLPGGITSFIDENEFIQKIKEIRNNTSNESSFRKRFFTWFNMFRIIRLMNHVHNGYMHKKPVNVSAYELLNILGREVKSDDTLELLQIFRLLEKEV